MLPVISHEVRTRSWPYATVALAGIAVVVFAFELSLGGGLPAFLVDWGLSPARTRAGASAHGVVTVLTSMFLHVGPVHLIGNLWFLLVFGDAVEHALGHRWFLGIYLLSGFFGGIAYVAVMGPGEPPVVGASGAVCGVMAASLVLWPGARLRVPGILLVPFVLAFVFVALQRLQVEGMPLLLILTALGLGLLVAIALDAGGLVTGLVHGVRAPAALVLGFFLCQQAFAGLLAVVSPGHGGSVGWLAHLGGCAAGAALALVCPARRAADAGTPAAPVASADRRRTFLGKPLAWSRGWLLVCCVLLGCVAALGVLRLHMGADQRTMMRSGGCVAPAQTGPAGEWLRPAAASASQQR